MKKRTIILFITLLAVFSCSKDSKEYGVVLWDTEDENNNGMIVEITDNSELYEEYTVNFPQQEITKQYKWHFIKKFKNKKQATEFVKNYSPIRTTYVTTERSYHIIREDMSGDSERIGSILSGELAKVLSISKEKIEIAGYNEYWYEILLPDGRHGFSYGSHLITKNTAKKDEKDNTIAELETLIEALTEKKYPEKFKILIEKKIFDLQELSLDYFIQADIEKGAIIIKTTDIDREIKFSDITKANEKVFDFDKGRASLILNPNNIIYEYFENNIKKSISFSEIAEFEILINEINQERDDLLAEIISDNTIRQSNAYGRLVFNEDKTFSWTGNSKLVPQILTQESNKGTISFEKTLSAKYQSRYKGILTFNFDSGEKHHFIIKTDDKGTLHLESTNIRCFDGNILTKLDLQPIIIVMRPVVQKETE